MYIDNYLGRIIRLRGRCSAVPTSWTNLSDMVLAILYGTVAAAAAKVDVSSSSADDDGSPVGTGALTLLILGLDANYRFQAEIVTMNGTTIVQSTKSFLRVFSAEVLTAGIVYGNVGTIYVVKTGTGGTYSTPGVPGTLTSAWLEIAPTIGIGTSGIFTVPADASYAIKGISGASVGNAALMGVWSHRPTIATDNALKLSLSLTTGSSIPGSQNIPAPVNEIFSEKTDLYLRAISKASTADVDLTAWLERTQGNDVIAGALLNL